MDDLKTYPGEKLHNKAYNFLLSIGIPAEELDSIIDILVEGEKPANYHNHQEVVLAKDFTGDGTEMKEIPATATGNASRAHPKQYFTLGADQSVTLEFDPDYTGEAKVLAYLGSTDSSSSKKIADSIALEFDFDEIEIDDVTFADAGFGQGEGRTYYAPVTLATVDVVEGNTEVTITGIANNLNIGAVALIPTEQIAWQISLQQFAAKTIVHASQPKPTNQNAQHTHTNCHPLSRIQQQILVPALLHHMYRQEILIHH
jgi:hypothetical protein